MDAGGNGPDWGRPVPPIVNETKLQIIAMMDVVDGPVSAEELWTQWGGEKPQTIVDYHLCTLVKAGAAKLVSGPELRFALQGRPVPGCFQRPVRERCR